MGPYAFTQAFLSGFFGFAALAAVVIWSLRRRDTPLLTFAIGCAIWAAQSGAVLGVTAAETIEEAQRALQWRAAFASLGIAATAWMFAEVTAVPARAFLWFTTPWLAGISLAALAGVRLLGTVTTVERASLPWGEIFFAPVRTDPSAVIVPTYLVVVAVCVFMFVCVFRLTARDRIGGALMAVAAVGLSVSVLSSALVDFFRVTLPYPGMAPIAVGVVVIALQFARTNQQRDEQLVAATRRFRAIFDQTFQFIGLMSVDGTLLEANDTALKFAMVRSGDVIGKKFWDTPWWAHSRDLQNRLRDAVRTAARGDAVRFEVTHPGPDGRLHSIDFSLKPVRDARGVVTLLIPEGHDLTEQKEAEKALRASEERFRFLIQNQTEFVVSCQPDTTLTFVNDSCLRSFGVAVDAMVGTCLLDRVAPDYQDALANQIRELTREAPDATIDCQVIAGTNGARWTRWTMRGTFDDYDHLVALQMTGHDIHDGVVSEETRRKLEQQLLQAQKMEALGQLAGGVAHDFNNLLTVIAGHTDMLLLEGGDARRQHDLEQIRLASERAASMTRQLLAFSRQSVFEPKVIDVNAVVAQTEAMLRRTIGEHIELVVHADTGLRPVRADPDQFSRVLLNMAINARDAMPTGGRLSIETRHVSVAHRDGGRSTPGDFVLLTMSDTGCGMSAESKARLFEPFYTTKPQGRGTGLGLAVVDGIVKQSGGWIDVESELNVGTTFQIFLPVTQSAAMAPSAESRLRASARGTETVLLVEDEAAVREMTQAALEAFGYTVVAASGGEEAQTILSANRERVDIVLTDVVMPGISGPELAEHVRDFDPSIPVVFMSGYTSDAMLRQGIETGEANFVQKPFSTVALAAKLREVLDRR